MGTLTFKSERTASLNIPYNTVHFIVKLPEYESLNGTIQTYWRFLQIKYPNICFTISQVGEEPWSKGEEPCSIHKEKQKQQLEEKKEGE